MSVYLKKRLIISLFSSYPPNILSLSKPFYPYEQIPEPDFHEDGMDNPDNPTNVVLSDEQLLEYLDKVEKKTLDYLDTLTDEMLYEKPKNCPYTRMELVLRQYRHISFHTGMLNGQTAVATGQFPMWVSQTDKYVDDGILFGRYRKGQVKAV